MRVADRINPGDAGELAWFLGRTFISSNFGAQLDTARVLARDSKGKATTAPPLWERDPQGRIIGQRQYVHLGARSSKGGEPSTPAPDHHEARRYDVVGDRLRAVGRLSPRAERVLRIYYGDEGARWAGQPLGRVWCLSSLTKTGNATLGELAEACRLTGRQTIGDGAEQLAAEVKLDGLRAASERRRLARLVTGEAEALLREAGQAWNLARQLPDDLPLGG
jgi:hypothetical protein